MLSCVIVPAAMFAAGPSNTYAQTQLITPDWSDAAASRYLEERNSGASPPGPLIQGFATPPTRFSLPVLGLKQGFAAAQPGSAPTGSFIDPLSIAPGVEWWPKCGATDAVLAFAADPNGTWYSATFDFGCLTIVVAGDRSSDPGIPAALREELSERRGDISSPVDEDDDPNKVLSVTYEIVRFNVPYVVTIECTGESTPFCRDKAAHHTLLGRLSILEGEPRP